MIYKIYYWVSEAAASMLMEKEPPNLKFHRYLKDVEIPVPGPTVNPAEWMAEWPTRRDLDFIYNAMQAHNWADDNYEEVNAFLELKGLSHTSLSVGDIVEDPDHNFWICKPRGWGKLRFKGL